MTRDFRYLRLEPHVAGGVTGFPEQKDLKADRRLMTHRNASLAPSGSAARMRVPAATTFRGMLGLAALLALSACAQLNPSAPPRLDETGASVKGVYIVTEKNIDRVRARALETVNTNRAAAGLAPVVLDTALVAAADSHSQSMAQQGRAWHFGADGSSPMDRARRAGFSGNVLGELVSETYESEVQTIAAWMDTPAQRAVLLDPGARRMGIGVLQEQDYKLWWTVTIAD